MLRLFFLAEGMWKSGFRMNIQIHDELICSVPQKRLDLIERKVAIMESPCTIHGRTFTIPVEAELMKSWDPKNTVKWKGLGKLDYLALVEEKEKETLKKLGTPWKIT
jgi:hypothetical protein